MTRHIPMIIAATAALALLTACGKSDDKNGTEISITGTDSKGKPAGAKLDGKAGRVTLDVPGVKLDLPLPKIELDAGDFGIGDVSLYPGTKINTLNIATDKKGDGEDEVKITFDAPATPDKVIAWFAEQMKAEGFTLNLNGASIAGKTDDGDPFTLNLTPGADGHSIGVLDLMS